MSAAAPNTADQRDWTRDQVKPDKPTAPWRARLFGAQRRAQPFLDFWTKLNNDWVFNLSGLLAYNFLMSIFPLLLVLLAIAGVILNAASPAAHDSIQNSIGGILPGGSAIVTAVTGQLQRSVGLLLGVGIVVAAFTGSRLFITLENCFGVIFRLRGRDPLHQNLMAFGMLAIYIVLIPIIALSSVIPSAILAAVGPLKHNPGIAFLIQALGIVLATLFAFLLFAAMYIIVPNRPVRLGEVWQGTLVAAALLTIYNLLFPFYESYFLHPGNYGSLAGFAVVILIFFYYLAFILLVGAEVNSWVAGQRQTEGDLAAILHEVQAHDTTRGVAGPTAGLPQEDLQHAKGAEAMRDTPAAIEHERQDHKTDIQPPRPAEAHLPGPPRRSDQQREQRDEQAEEQPRQEGQPAPDR
jgi:YihY family inner membrane protein